MDPIKEKLFSLADAKYKEFHSSLCPGTKNIIGIRVPILRAFAKQIVKEDWRKIKEQIGNEYYEEILLQGMIIGLANMSWEERIQSIQEFVPKIDNWAVCDTTCAGFKFTKKHLPEMWEFLRPYWQSEKEFEIRFAVVMLLNFYLQEEYITQVLSILNQIHHEGYYVKMAVAWAISIAYIKFPKETNKLLENNQLDVFTYNKALQKILESCRVSEEEKSKIRKRKSI